ncbi:MAG: DMT family transporter [Chloroflexi bacterium]|nr:DMT family transporter [Chloroflexota bacterium]
MNVTLGIVAGLLSAFTWAATTVMIRSQSSRIDAISINAFRSLVAGLFFVVATLVLGKLPAFAELTPLLLAALGASLVVGFIIGDTLFFRAITEVGVSVAMPIAMSYPLYVLIVAWLFLKEHITIATVLGTLLVVGGTIVVALSAPPAPAGAHKSRRLGIILAIGAAFGWAFSTVFLRIGVQSLDVFVAGTVRLSLTSLILLIWRAVWMDVRPFRSYGSRSLIVLTVAALLGTGLGSVFYLTAVQQAGAALAATLSTAAPLFATPISVIFLGEKLNRRNVLGMLMCVAGVWAVTVQL